MLIVYRCLRIKSVIVVNKTLLSTGMVSNKQGGLIRRPLRVWTPEQAKKLAKGKLEDDLADAEKQNFVRFPEELTNKKFSLPKGLSYVKLEDGDKRFR